MTSADEAFEGSRYWQEDPSWFQRRWLRWTLVALLLAIPGYLLTLALSAKPHVFLVSGIDVPYSVLINGQEILLLPKGRVPLDLPFGPVSVTPAPRENTAAMSPMEVDLEASLFSRIDNQRVFVINPDRNALVSREQVIYTGDTYMSSEEAAPIELFVGEAFYVFDEIDDAFTDPPEAVLPPNSDQTLRIVRVALQQLTRISSAERVDRIMDHLGKDATLAYISRSLDLNPENTLLLEHADRILTPEELLAILQPRLPRRPIRVGCHRHYQILQHEGRTREDILTNYNKRLAADPTNTSLLYLVGRLIADPEKGTRTIQQSTAGKHPEPFGYYAIAHDQITRCHFEAALTAIEKARAMLPSSELFEQIHDDLLKATHRWDEWEARCREALEPEPLDGWWIAALLTAHTTQGKLDEVAKAKRIYLVGLEDLGASAITLEERAVYDAILNARLALEGDAPHAFAASAKKTKDPDWHLLAVLAEGDAGQASHRIAKDEILGTEPYTWPSTRLPWR